MQRGLTRRAPTDDQIGRAKRLADDLLMVLRIEYDKARGGTGGYGGGGGGGGYGAGAGYGQQQQGGYQGAAAPAQDAYAGYGQAQPAAAADASAGAAPGAVPQEGTDAWAQYAAYWAAYGYDVNDPQCK